MLTNEYVPLYLNPINFDRRIWKERLEYIDMIDQRKK
jgi:hypothetical protein